LRVGRPDRVDAAAAPGGAVTRVAAVPEPIELEPGGFDWDDATIGAAGTLGLVLALAGGAAVVSRRRTPATP